MLVKCHLHKIVKDYTEQPGICPQCGITWGRPAIIRNKPALKVVGGKLYWK